MVNYIVGLYYKRLMTMNHYTIKIICSVNSHILASN